MVFVQQTCSPSPFWKRDQRINVVRQFSFSLRGSSSPPSASSHCRESPFLEGRMRRRDTMDEPLRDGSDRLTDSQVHLLRATVLGLRTKGLSVNLYGDYVLSLLLCFHIEACDGRADTGTLALLRPVRGHQHKQKSDEALSVAQPCVVVF